MDLYRCAVCGSTRIVTEVRNEGYNTKKGVIGTALFGAIGALAGTNGKEVTYYHCGDCGQVLNKCMSEYELMELDFSLRTQDSSVFLDRTIAMMKKYPNAGWDNEKILKAKSNQSSIKSHDNENMVDSIESNQKTFQEEKIDLEKKILEIASKYEDKFTLDEICNNEQLSECSKIKIMAVLKNLVDFSCLERFKDDKVYYKFITKENLKEEQKKREIEEENRRKREEKFPYIEREILEFAFKQHKNKFTADELRNCDISLSEKYPTIKIAYILNQLVKKSYLSSTRIDYTTYYMFNEDIYTEILNILTDEPKSIKEILNESNLLKDFDVRVIYHYCNKLVENKKAKCIVIEEKKVLLERYCYKKR